jgi:hypothetical protein
MRKDIGSMQRLFASRFGSYTRQSLLRAPRSAESRVVYHALTAVVHITVHVSLPSGHDMSLFEWHWHLGIMCHLSSELNKTIQ